MDVHTFWWGSKMLLLSINDAISTISFALWIFCACPDEWVKIDPGYVSFQDKDGVLLLLCLTYPSKFYCRFWALLLPNGIKDIFCVRSC
jgi:hypothetical protein